VPFDDDAEADLPTYRPPPHPDDRLWRHPSEMGSHRIVPAGAPAQPEGTDEATADGGRAARRRPWGAFAAAGAVGALVAGGGVVALGIGERVVERPVTERVELDPASPGLGLPRAGALETVRAQVAPAVVSVGDGSGVVVRDDGIVVTSAALVTDGESPVVHLTDGQEVAADLVGTDPTTGVAVLDLDGDHTSSVLGSAATLYPGRPAFAVQAPTSGEAETVTGVLGPSQRYLGPLGDALDGIEIEGDADPGALGGPIVDERGAVIGVVTAVEEGNAWYAAPVEVVDRVSTDLLTDGRAHHARLGIEGTEASGPVGADEPMVAGPEAEDPAGTTTAAGEGALVASVVEDSPAEKGGLAVGDVIVAVGDRPISRMADLTLCLRASAPGDRVDLTLVRPDGSVATLVFTLDEAPAANPVATDAR
jgi:S1-C subfamily serine protease